MRLIDADAAIQWVEENECYTDKFKRIMEGVIDKQPTVDAVPVEWISVEDRLPVAYENVLVCENDDVLLAHWNGHEWVQCDLYEYVTLYPTYWMELPKPQSTKMKGEPNDNQRM